MTKSTHTTHRMDSEERDALEDSEFAFPKQRKMPISDASHVRNAIARFDQVEDVTDEEREQAFKRIKKAADKFDVELAETSWRQLGRKPHTENSAHHTRHK